ncbi:hypothetical protein ASPSYDRAFT_50156 [Aspergillus sydowii CBS 593.65]|uniref:Uncharacterized protein n=1 Tax=Aspergillus sydowii CBS 593.65 TaxID=1036612 RepID=A0A1L9T3Y1_9EURO|nr:uncharacterized protein ASPSYDRAFT_50156 [Aspergillus sydowii CBS 593.65]OJJ54142.1 hypothetical protein ASPSYDRAFT_50156 [Aspergillus sydowii CBS 593.65]
MFLTLTFSNPRPSPFSGYTKRNGGDPTQSVADLQKPTVRAPPDPPLGADTPRRLQILPWAAQTTIL